MGSAVRKGSRRRRLAVCLISFHPLVLDEYRHLLSRPDFHLETLCLQATSVAELQPLTIPQATIYVVDALPSQAVTEALIGRILDRYPGARLVVLAEKFTEANSFPLLRLGAKGLLAYEEAARRLPEALPAVASGGFWVPRSLLSGLLDSILRNSHGPRLASGTANLTRREREVMNALLENLSNKEIASNLLISERTVKFHVSNLLAKFGVRRRADLILLSYQTNASASLTAPKARS